MDDEIIKYFSIISPKIVNYNKTNVFFPFFYLIEK